MYIEEKQNNIYVLTSLNKNSRNPYDKLNYSKILFF